MSKQLFIFGAGFSNAIAGLPLGKEICSLIFNKAKKTEQNDAGKYEGAQSFLLIWKYLQSQITPLVNILCEDGTKIATLEGSTDDFSIDIEYMMTIIDLNISSPFIPKGIGVDLQSCPIPYLKGFTVDTLKNVRNFIRHCIAEIVSPIHYSYNDIKSNLLKILTLVKPEDNIITFNYDMLIEQGLWDLGLFNPMVGYTLGKISRFERFSKDIPIIKSVNLLKLHGSINWQLPGFFDDEEIEILCSDIYNGFSYFEGLEVDQIEPDYRKRYLLNPGLIMPTFIKQYESPFEIDLIKKAVEATRSINKLYIIGYSVPKADTIANFILSQVPKDVSIVIVNLDEEKELEKRLFNNYKFKSDNIIFENSDITDWIRNDFEYIKYQQSVESEKIINEMLNIDPA